MFLGGAHYAHALSSSLQCKFGKSLSTVVYNQRRLWRWLDNLFNSIDKERLKKYGPDRACAEWLLKNGASVKFQIQNELITNYNELAPEDSELVKDHVIEVFAHNAPINHVGFEHFKDCNHIAKVTLSGCKLIEDRAMYKLQYLRDSLKYLEVVACYNVTDKGIMSISRLHNLDTVIIGHLPSVKDKAGCEEALKETFKHSKIQINL